jgi:ATP-dependent DNA helicase RecQ
MQQVGRAGRDGEPAVGLLLYREADLGLQKSLTSPARLEADVVADVVDAVRETAGRKGASVDAIAEQTELTNGKLDRTLQLLEAEGAIRISVEDHATVADRATDPADLAERVVAQQDRFRDWRDQRLASMRGYATTDGCRRQALLTYFGETAPDVCNACDNCRAGRSRANAQKHAREPKPSAISQPWPVNATVQHKTFGRGIVQAYEAGNVIVLFESVGRKAIALTFAQRRKLIKAC